MPLLGQPISSIGHALQNRRTPLGTALHRFDHDSLAHFCPGLTEPRWGISVNGIGRPIQQNRRRIHQIWASRASRTVSAKLRQHRSPGGCLSSTSRRLPFSTGCQADGDLPDTLRAPTAGRPRACPGPAEGPIGGPPARFRRIRPGGSGSICADGHRIVIACPNAGRRARPSGRPGERRGRHAPRPAPLRCVRRAVAATWAPGSGGGHPRPGVGRCGWQRGRGADNWSCAHHRRSAASPARRGHDHLTRPWLPHRRHPDR
jgi:hypothetical protein